MIGYVMEVFKQILANFFLTTKLMIPFSHIAFYLVFLSFCLFYKKYRLGFSISFLFLFYLGYIVNCSLFIKNLQIIDTISWPLIIYIGIGFYLIILSLFSFFAPEEGK